MFFVEDLEYLPRTIYHVIRKTLWPVNKEFRWVVSVVRQRLHHAQHLSHVGFWLLKNTLQIILVLLTTHLNSLLKT